MTPSEIDGVLAAAEAQIETGGTADLRALGFWKAVGVVKRDSALIDRFADRIGAVDRAVFLGWAPLLVPMWLGTALASLATIIGLTLVGVAYYAESLGGGFLFLAGTAVILGATHGLGHLIFGRVVGIRFTVWFVGYRRPQPGVKTDYASYLRAPARSRAWMHASGAIVTKAVPFLLLPSALAAGIPGWAIAVLITVGVGQVIADIAWSTKSSDWAKYTREMRYVS